MGPASFRGDSDPAESQATRCFAVCFSPKVARLSCHARPFSNPPAARQARDAEPSWRESCGLVAASNDHPLRTADATGIFATLRPAFTSLRWSNAAEQISRRHAKAKTQHSMREPGEASVETVAQVI